MSTDKQVLVMVDPAEVMVSREKTSSSSSSGRWRMCLALLGVALCAAAAVFFTFNKTQHKPDQTDEIRHTLRQVSSSAKAAIHLTGVYNEKYSTSVEWRDDEGQSFKEGGLKLKKNEILIPHNGLYFVYSQASYRVSCSTGEDEEETLVHLSHMVSRWSSSYNSYKPLLSNMRTACKKNSQSVEEEWFSDVYMGAVFKLEAGDRLRTDMDTKMLPKVEGEDGKTFFGVFSL